MPVQELVQEQVLEPVQVEALVVEPLVEEVEVVVEVQQTWEVSLNFYLESYNAANKSYIFFIILLLFLR